MSAFVFRHKATLLGAQGHIANCIVLARTRPRRGEEAAYDRGAVLHAPDHLTEGEYLVAFDNHVMHCVKENREWSVSTSIHRIGYCPAFLLQRDPCASS